MVASYLESLRSLRVGADPAANNPVCEPDRTIAAER